MTSLEAKQILESFTKKPALYIGYTDEDGFAFECERAIMFVTPDCCIWGQGGLLHEDVDARLELEASAEYFCEAVDQDDEDEARARDYAQQWHDFLNHIGYRNMR